MNHPPEPTAKQCTERTEGEWEGRRTLALWYPSMGGYVGRAVAVDDGECIDVHVWHDGEFPFGGDRDTDGPLSVPAPVVVHHCDPAQFVEFGQDLMRWRSR